MEKFPIMIQSVEFESIFVYTIINDVIIIMLI